MTIGYSKAQYNLFWMTIGGAWATDVLVLQPMAAIFAALARRFYAGKWYTPLKHPFPANFS